MEINLHWRIGEQSYSYTLSTDQATPQPLKIGRDPRCDIQIEAQSVSRWWHAEVFTQEGRFYLRNLSQNSITKVNKHHLSRQDSMPLKSGDLLTLGRVQVWVDRRPIIADGPFMLACPQCDRLVSVELDQCPWDGTVLFSGS